MAFEMNDYERGFIAGMDYQAESSVDKAVNAISKREWVGLTEEEGIAIELGLRQYVDADRYDLSLRDFARAIEAKLKEKNT